MNCETFEWEKICPNDPLGGNIPDPRDSHACTKLGSSMYIFGGSNGKSPLNDMFSFNLSLRNWSKIPATGEIPSCREGHSSIGLEDRYILVFGGWNGKTIFNNLFLFDNDNNFWKKIECENELTGRESHSCSLVKDYIYIFGGQGLTIRKKDTYFNDLIRIKVNIKNLTEKGTCRWEKVISKNGLTPSHRTSHSATIFKDRFIFIIGGEGYEDKKDNLNEKDEDNYYASKVN